MKTSIELNNMEFYAHHGLLPQETVAGNTYRVSLRMEADIVEAMRTDNVELTVNYADVYNDIRQLMDVNSGLLEHVAGRIVDRLLGDYPLIESLWLKVEKLNPPMPGVIESSAVVVETSRQEWRV